MCNIFCWRSVLMCDYVTMEFMISWNILKETFYSVSFPLPDGKITVLKIIYFCYYSNSSSFFFCQRFFLQCFLVNFHIFFHLWWWKFFLYINQTRNSLCKSIYFVSWSIHQQFVEQILLMLKVIIIALYTSRIMCKLSCNSLYPAI